MKCDVCGGALQWRSTNTRNRLGKYKCKECGHIQYMLDKWRPPEVVKIVPCYYYVKDGKYIVRYKSKYYASYENEETAKLVVEELKKRDWDKEQLPSIHEFLNIVKRNRRWVKA